MLTFNQLRDLVQIPDGMEATPRVRQLQNCGAEILVREVMGRDSSITVYKNGYVHYKDRGRSVVFPFPQNQEYQYRTAMETYYIPERFWGNENWYIGLILFGSDRLSESNRKRETQDGKMISYSAVSDDWKVLADRRMEEAIDQLFKKELVKEVLSYATEKQRRVLNLYYLEEMSQKAIAEELGVSRKAVTDSIRKGIERIRKAYGVSTKGKKRGKYNHTAEREQPK